MNGQQTANTVQPFVFGIPSASRCGCDKWRQVATTSAFVETPCIHCLSEAKQISCIEQRPWGGDNCTL